MAHDKDNKTNPKLNDSNTHSNQEKKSGAKKETKNSKKDVFNKIKDLLSEKKIFEDEISQLKKIIDDISKRKADLENRVIEESENFKKIVLSIQEKANSKTKEVSEENHKKLQNEIAHIRKYGAKHLLKNLIEPLNNLEMAMRFGTQSSNLEVQNYVNGFNMILNQVHLALEAENIHRIEPKIGDEFDHKFHESISYEINAEMDNKIIRVHKVGYRLHDMVIQPASVVIGKAKETNKHD